MALPSALAPLCAVPNWMLWRAVEREGQLTKPPYQVRSPRRLASTADPKTWAPYELAAQVAKKEGLDGTRGGVGLGLKNSRRGAIDLDKCVGEDGTIADAARGILARARKLGLYVEISPSGRGIHVWGLSIGAEVHTRWVLSGGVVIEVFRDTHRFVTVTGRQLFAEDWEGEDGEDWGSIDALIDELIAGRPEGKKSATGANGQARARTRAGAGDSSPSGLFNKAVSRLAEQGLNVDEITAQMRKYAKRYDETSIKKYEAQGRLREEVERVMVKWEAKHGAQLAVEWSTGRMPKAKTLADALIAVEALGVKCSNDEFHVRHFVEGEVLGRWEGELTDAGVAFIRGLILKTYGFDPGKDILNDALSQLAIENSFDPVRDYLDGLVWDEREGGSLIDTWVMDYLGCEDTPLNRAIGVCTLIAAVRRVRVPGTKFDQIVVFEGEEGTGKSKAIELLAGEENFSDQFVLDMRHAREQQELFQGVWLGEFADLKGMAAAEANAMKAYLSRTSDRARPAYGRRRVDQRRRTILFGTTNERGYLKGAYGNRRWWLLKTGRILLRDLARDRDRLWAEAAAREAKGESIELPRALWKVAKTEQDKRLEEDPWDLRLERVRGVERFDRRDGLPGWEERIAARDLYAGYLGLKASDEKGGGTARRVAESMRRLGWEPTIARLGSGPPVSAWVRKHDKA